MVSIKSFGVVAFKKSNLIEPILTRIQAWSAVSKGARVFPSGL
jgi:hypothetical protein